MTKKTFTWLYLLISTLANIALTILVITFFAVLSFVLLRFVFHLENSSVFAADLMLCLVGGLVLSFFLYNKLSSFVIRRFGWEEKFDNSMFRFRSPSGSAQKKMEEKPKRKTNMPVSVLDDDMEE